MTPKTLNTVAIALLWFAISALPANSAKNERAPNHLLGAQSPYLQQHIYNVVDWYPWGKEALEKAKREQKPIFLSVGYSTCHWCHVMSKESFDNEEIGNFLNENFISIKIDRERRPDLDEQFMLATQALSGRGGWPNSVFLTSDAKPFYAQTYLPPETFMGILGQIDKLWAEDKASLQEEGERISTAIVSYMNRTEAAKAVSGEAVSDAVSVLMEQVDYFSGGLGTAPKFPQESALLFLLERAKRGNQEALGVVIGALDGMIKGGIHDHVGGGFHRYAVDPQWVVPHFEKMLYNQAMIGRVLVQTYELTGLYRYKHAALRMFDYVVREMQDESGGFYSAQDADSYSESGQKGEGHFYIWSKQELDNYTHPSLDELKATYDISEDGNFEGQNILTLVSRIDEIANSRNTTETALYEKLDAGLDFLRSERETNRRAPHKDTKIVVSWNAVMIETLAQAAFVFDRPDYWKAAKASADYIVSAMLHTDGLKRVSFEGEIGVDGQLADYAGLGNALITIEDFTPETMDKPDYSNAIFRIAKNIRSKFADQTKFEEAPYRMTAIVDGLGNFIPMEDNPIPSGNSLLLKLFHKLAENRGELEFKKRARILASTLSGFALASPAIRGTLLNTAFDINNGASGNTRHVANGNVFVQLKLDRAAKELRLNINTKEGWHINSNKPLEKYFVPTVLKINGEGVDPGSYPEPLVKKLGFNANTLSLYEGELNLAHPLPENQQNSARKISLSLQACSDEICLEPEELDFHYWSDSHLPVAE